MAVRFDNSHYNIDTTDVNWTVDIIDRDGSPVGSFEVDDGGIILHKSGPTLGMEPGLWPSSVTIPMMVRNAQHFFLLDDIRTSDSERFTAEVKRAGTREFIGRFKIDGISYPDKGFPFVVKLTVEDGLASLKNIDYTNITADRLWDVVKWCFDQAGISALYSGDMITAALDVYETSMAVTTGNPLYETRVGYKAFRDDLSKAPTCESVLNDILVAFGCRLYYAGGLFHWEQIILRADAATFRRFTYDDTFTLTGTDNAVSLEKTIDTSTPGDRFPQATNTWKWLAPVSKVCITHRFTQKNFAAGLTWSQLDETEKSLGYIYVDTDTKLRIRGTFQQIPSLVGSFGQASEVEIARYVWRITIKIGGTAVCRQTLTFDTGGANFWNPRLTPATFISMLGTPSVVEATADVVQWEDDAQTGTIEMISDPFETFDRETTNLVVAPSLTAGNSYELRMKVELHEVINPNLDDISGDADYQWDWSLDDLQVTLSTLEPGDAQNIGAEYCIENDTTGNYEPWNLSTRIGDATESDRGLEIWNGTEWVPSLQWDRDGTPLVTNFKLLRQTSRDLFSMRKEPRRVYNGRIIAYDFAYDSRYTYQSIVMIPMRGDHSTHKDVFRGDMVELDVTDISGISNDIPTDIQNPEDLVPVPADPPTDWPPGLTPATPPTDLVTAELLDSGPYVDFDIENNAGVTASAGDYIQIINLTTLETEIVQLTTDLTGAATQNITIVSHTFTSTFPIGSPIGIAAVEDFEWVTEAITSTGVTAYATSNTMSDLSIVKAGREDNWVKLWVEGARRFYDAIPTKFSQFGQGSTTQITFPAAFAPPSGVDIIVQIKIPRS